MQKYMSEVHNLIIYKMENGELNLESIEALKNVLGEYKTNIKVVEEELEACKRDHLDLREEMDRLLAENRDLRAQLKASKESEVDFVVSKLKNQDPEIESIINRNFELLLELQKDYSEAIHILEARCSSLRLANDQLTVKTQLLESQLSQVASQMTSASERNLALNNSLREVTEKERELRAQYLAMEARFIELDRSYQIDKIKYANVYKYEKTEESLREQLKDAEKARDELQAALERCHENLAQLVRSRAEERAKIEEAIAVAEEAQRDRDMALQKEAASAEEVVRLQKELAGLIELAGARVGEETAAVVKQCEAKVRELTDQLAVSHQDGQRKTAELRQLQKECTRLQGLLNQASSAESLTRTRDKQLDRLYHELHATETECLQLRMENESFQDPLRVLQEKCRRGRQERQRLRGELRMTQHQLQACQHELSLTSQRAELLRSQLYSLGQEQSDSVAFVTSHDQISNSGMKVVSTTKVVELYKRLEDSYGQMNSKWKTEMSALTEKFETKLKKAKSKPKAQDNTATKKSSEDDKCDYKGAVAS